jgi:hypothetical protein
MRSSLIVTTLGTLALAVGSLGLAGCSSSDAADAAAGQQAQAEPSREQREAAYLRQVRATTPEVASVSVDQLIEAAAFTCTAYPDIDEPGITAARINQAGDALIEHGYIPSPAVTGYTAPSPWMPAARVVEAARSTC